MWARLLTIAMLLGGVGLLQAEERQIQVDVTMVTVSESTFKTLQTAVGWKGWSQGKSSIQSVVESDEGVAQILKIVNDNKESRNVASPTLVTRNGRPASFLTGGEHAIPTKPDEAGKPRIEYRKVGREMECMATIRDDGRIYLETLIWVRAANPGTGVKTSFGFVPGFDEQSIRAAVELAPGQSFVLALPSPVKRDGDGVPTTIAIIKPHVIDEPSAIRPVSAVESVAVQCTSVPCVRRVRRSILRR